MRLLPRQVCAYHLTVAEDPAYGATGGFMPTRYGTDTLWSFGGADEMGIQRG